MARKSETPAKDEKTGRFVTGNIGGGRKKGSRNKLGEAFCDDVYAEWQEHGRQALIDMREEKPGDFVKVVAGILPKEMNLRVGEFDELTDDQLARQLASIASQLARAGVVIGEGDQASEGPQSIN